MTRNTERRVEIAVPIYDDAIKQEIADYISVQLRDSVKGRIMQSNGMLEKLSGNVEAISSQDICMHEASEKGEMQKTGAVKKFLQSIFSKR